MSPSLSIPNSQLLARALRGGWRTTPPPSEIDAVAWPKITPLLVGSGAGALAWRRVRHGAQHDWPAVAALREAHRAQALHAMLQERQIAATFAHLQQHGIAAILLKGWSSARLYPEAGLRPFGDIDVLIQPAQKALTEKILGVSVDDESEVDFVDTKTYLRPVYGFDAAQVWQARQTVTLQDTSISILCAEDQLRMLCLHFLRHGAWRPLWLCDIAVALETRPDNFDWTRCLSSNRRCADAVACALGLAYQLLDARIDDTPVAGRGRALPSWLVPAVLRQWETPLLSQHDMPRSVREALRQGEIWQELARRWPSPIEAALMARTPFDWAPGIGQLCHYIGIGIRFFQRNAQSRR